MSDNVQQNSAFNAAATTKVHHAKLNDLHLQVLNKLKRGGVRSHEPSRNIIEAQEMLNKIPPAHRSGIDSKSAATNTEKYLSDKHASHIHPHSKGGSNHPENIRWESHKDNIARGAKPMSWQEKIRLDAKWHFDNLTGAVKAGVQAAPLGAAIGAVTAAPFSLLTNGLRVVRGEISAEEAAMATVKDTLVGGAVGGATAFATTTVAAACPPIAIALTAVAPALAVIGGAGMVYEFFNVLNEHKQQVKEYYESLTQQQLKRLQEIEDEIIYEHKKNLEFIAETKALNEEIKNRAVAPGIKGAMNRYLESVAIAKSLGLTSIDSKLIPAAILSSLPPNQ